MLARRAASRVLIALAGGKVAAAAAAATLAGAFFVSVAVPGLSVLPPATSPSQQLIAISLQSALLGIDDEVGKPSARVTLATAQSLGLPPVGLGSLTLDQLHTDPHGHVAATGPLVVAIKAVEHRHAEQAGPAAPSAPPAPSPAAAAPAAAAPDAQPADGPPPAAPDAAPAPAPPAQQQPQQQQPADDGSGGAPRPAVTPPAAVPSPPRVPSQPPAQSGSTLPVFDVHPDVTVEAAGAAGTFVAYTLPTAHDDGGGVAVFCLPASGGIFPLGASIVTCAARNGAGVAHGSFTVDVRDTTPPALQLPHGISVVADSSDGAVVSFAASASDLVDGSVPVRCDPASGTRFPVGTTDVTCTAQDAAGNAARASFGVSVAPAPDPRAPSFAAYADVTAEATDASGATVAYDLPTAVDAGSDSVPVSCLPASGSVFPLGTTRVTCDAADAGGSAHLSFSVTVADTTPPTLQLPSGINIAASSSDGAAVSFSASATDLVDGSVAATCLPASGSVFAPGSTQVTCSATDAHGNIGYGSFFVTVGNAPDTLPPTIAAHPNVTVEATSASGAIVSYAAPAGNDDRDGVVPVSCLPASGSLFPVGTTTVACTSRDAAGNSAGSSFTVRVRDSTAPTIAAHADVTAEAADAQGATVAYASPTATDNLDGSVPVGCLPASGTVFALGSTTVTCTARDAAGNTATSTFAVVVGDHTPPTIAAAGNVTAEATGAVGAAVSFTPPVATDNLDGSVAVSCDPAPGSTFPVGSTQVTCSAQDSAGNSASSTFDVTVEDTTPPALSLPGDMSVTPTGPSGATVTYAASATDLVDGTLTPSCSPASGTLFPLGTTTVDCSVGDSAGNTASGSFDVYVGTGSPPPDTTPPSLAAHADLTAEATGSSGATVTYTSPLATDNRDGTVPVSCVPASGSVFSVGATTVTCSAHDAAGNTATSTFAVRVADTTPPTIAAHANVTAEATGATGATVAYTPPTATDAVDGSVAVSCLPASGTVFAVGNTTVTCTARDGAGNNASSTFAVRVTDTTPPTITAHGNVTVEATSASGASVTYSAPTATDAVSGSVAVSCLPAAGTVFPLGSTTVTCTAQDAAGNRATSTFVVRVRDTTAPTLQVPAGVTVDAISASGAVVTFTATATDAVDGTDTVDCTPASGSTFAVGRTTVTCTAHDAAGNQAQPQTFVVTVQSAVTQLTQLNQLIVSIRLDPRFSSQLTLPVNVASAAVSSGNVRAAALSLGQLTKTVIDEVAKPTSRLTVAQGAEIAAAANQIQVTIGTIAGSSVIPPAEAGLFDAISAYNSLNLRGPAYDGLRTDLGRAGDDLVANQAGAACTALDGVIATATGGRPGGRLDQAQLDVLLPPIDAVERTLGC